MQMAQCSVLAPCECLSVVLQLRWVLLQHWPRLHFEVAVAAQSMGTTCSTGQSPKTKSVSLAWEKMCFVFRDRQGRCVCFFTFVSHRFLTYSAIVFDWLTIFRLRNVLVLPRAMTPATLTVRRMSHHRSVWNQQRDKDRSASLTCLSVNMVIQSQSISSWRACCCSCHCLARYFKPCQYVWVSKLVQIVSHPSVFSLGLHVRIVFSTGCSTLGCRSWRWTGASSWGGTWSILHADSSGQNARRGVGEGADSWQRQGLQTMCKSCLRSWSHNGWLPMPSPLSLCMSPSHIISLKTCFYLQPCAPLKTIILGGGQTWILFRQDLKRTCFAPWHARFTVIYLAKDLSVAGGQNGMQGERTSLIKQVFRVWDSLPKAPHAQMEDVRLFWTHGFWYPVLTEALSLFGECCRHSFTGWRLSRCLQLYRKGSRHSVDLSWKIASRHCIKLSLSRLLF